jgi:hypothetical protein
VGIGLGVTFGLLGLAAILFAVYRYRKGASDAYRTKLSSSKQGKSVMGEGFEQPDSVDNKNLLNVENPLFGADLQSGAPISNTQTVDEDVSRGSSEFGVGRPRLCLTSMFVPPLQPWMEHGTGHVSEAWAEQGTGTGGSEA